MALLSHGIDLVEVIRIKKIIRRQGKFFLQRVFSLEEQNYCCGKKREFEHFAARFAAKEAFLKAAQSFQKKQKAIPLPDISVRKSPSGQPFFDFSVKQLKQWNLPTNIKVSLSLAHEKEFAVATVLISKGS